MEPDELKMLRRTYRQRLNCADKVIDAIYNYFGNAEDTAEAIENYYEGVYESFSQYVEERFYDSLEFYNIPKDSPLLQYFDMDKFEYDVGMFCDIVKLPDRTVAIFNNGC